MNDTAKAMKPQARPAAAAPARKALPVVEAPPMEITGIKALNQASDVAVHWWSIMEMIREGAAHGETRKGTVPQWVLDAIGDWPQQHLSHDLHRQLMERAGQCLRLAADGESNLVFEIWTDRGQRLDGQYDFRAQADDALARWTEKLPTAKLSVTRVHRMQAVFGGHSDPALLDTLIGRVMWCGCVFATEDRAEEIHTVQDETGRCVYAPTSVLLAHPVIAQMTQEGRERVEYSQQHETKAAQLRTDAAKGGE